MAKKAIGTEVACRCRRCRLLPLVPRQSPPPASPPGLGTEMQPCALCGGAAFLYCEADLAFLCWACDAAVHGANFLVARHVRLVACVACRAVDGWRRVSGVGFSPVTSPCRSCCRRSLPLSPAEPCSPASSGSSCLTAESSTAAPPPSARPRASRRARPAVPETAAWLALESLCGRTGMRGWQRLAAAEAQAMDALPGRVAHAAALWHTIKSSAKRERSARSGAEDALRRLVACSRAPARRIVAAESKLARARARR